MDSTQLDLSAGTGRKARTPDESRSAPGSDADHREYLQEAALRTGQLPHYLSRGRRDAQACRELLQEPDSRLSLGVTRVWRCWEGSSDPEGES